MNLQRIPQQSLEFFSACAPFDQFSNDEIAELAAHVSVVYMTADNAETLLAEHPSSLFLISSGQFSVKDNDGPQRHLSEGDYFGYTNLLNDLRHPIEISVDSAGLIYVLDAQGFTDCCERAPTFKRFFASAQSDNVQQQAVVDSQSIWLYRTLDSLLSRTPVCTDQGASVFEAVQRMAEAGVSSLLVTDNDKLVGILTDRDIRNRVVAERVDLDSPVASVMTVNPTCINVNQTLFDAICTMSEKSIHHLPVVESETPKGMLTASDLIRHQRGNVLFIVEQLAKAQSLYELTRTSWQMPQYFAQHAKRLGDFDIAGKVLSQATDIMTRRLIVFFQQKRGSAPMDYCWLVYGSQAREDQTMGSDQDNALLLAEAPDSDAEQYFKDMADYVCTGLGKCGIKLCQGDIMAANPALRMPVQAAIEEAQGWVRQPTPEAIMHFNIFLDVRAVAGNAQLLDQLQSARAPLFRQPIFLAALARHANGMKVPLSMFQKFVFEKNATTEDAIDLKVNAVAIINSLVRIYALADGVTRPATLARLAAISDTSQLSIKERDNLRDIWLFLNRLRWRHQLSSKVTDNCVPVSQLSSLEKHQLKAAFQAIARAQQAVVLRFSSGLA